MTNMISFDNGNFGAIRTLVDDNGNPWFVGKDVAAALGYKEPTKAAREKVDPEDRGVSKMDTPSGEQEMIIINESGLYSLVLSSKLPSAKEFKRWVTSEVLPTLRKTGSYTVHKEVDKEELAVRAQEARVASANLLKELANNAHGTWRDVLLAHATKELTGEFLLPLPKSERKSYSATEVGEILGVSANRVGSIANKLGLKTEEYGAWFHNKAKFSNKEVESFRYYDNAVEVIRDYIGG